MKVRTMRWGYDGGGMACGPVEGNTIVEICVTHEKKNYFVCASRMSSFMKITVAPMPSFDILMELNHYDVDFDEEYGKVNHITTEEYDFDLSDLPEDLEEEMAASAFLDALKLVCMAMAEAYGPDDPTYEGAQKFIEKYVGNELSEFELEGISALCPEDDEEWYDLY